MNNLLSFFFGIISGMYIAQNYDIPDIKKLGGNLSEYIKSLEKNKIILNVYFLNKLNL